MLDSWVRYEGQVKQRQQKELAENIIAKVQKELENPKVLQQILAQSVADVESTSSCFLGRFLIPLGKSLMCPQKLFRPKPSRCSPK